MMTMLPTVKTKMCAAPLDERRTLIDKEGLVRRRHRENNGVFVGAGLAQRTASSWIYYYFKEVNFAISRLLEKRKDKPPTQMQLVDFYSPTSMLQIISPEKNVQGGVVVVPSAATKSTFRHTGVSDKRKTAGRSKELVS